ncbi:YggT family protein [Texcoconibacillus texcoconensis]|uniref:YggT family protein n=1 Tax=Texcoconibacillus texcoconensis TaxID=1095777 RepID=A0A840QLC0_9BACI|nr:YggT family protein [Texcoconibacillus texcoconensis]MBB5172157.1 YggT family protein [Texcoconibacillus texcoconensis]
MAMLGSLIINAMTIYMFLVIIYIFMSWVPNARESSFGQFLGSIVEPYLEPFRKIIPPLGMIDISPIVAIFVLNLAMRGVTVLFNNLLL